MGKKESFIALSFLLLSSASSVLAEDIDLTGYTLTFNEDFTTLALSANSPKGSSTWYGLPPNGGPGYFSSSQWDPTAFSVSDGILSDKAWMDSSQHWHSGFMASIDETGAGFSQLYGYFEIRCQMPNSGNGAWPSFWLTGSNSIHPPYQNNEEIDVLEWYGVSHDDSPGLMQQASHNWNPDGSQSGGLYSPQTKIPDGSQPWAGYHIYGVKIDPSNITWYIDGVQTNQITTPTSYLTSPFYLILDYGLGGGWPLSGMTNNSSLNVDWIRVYALPSF